MAKTRRELIDTVLDKLNILVPGQAPGEESVDKVDRYIDPKLASDAALGLPYVADVGTPNPPAGGQIDDALFLYVADRVAFACAGGFNLGDSPSLKVLHDQAEDALRSIGRPAPTRRTLHTDYQLSRRIHSISNFSRGT